MSNRQSRDSTTRERCDGCGTDVTENWEGGPNLTKLCSECAEEAWDDGYDPEVEEDDYAGACKHGGPAPCIDDICHALGGCMYWQDYQP